MARTTDGEGSHAFDAAVPKAALKGAMLQRLRLQAPQCYTTLCDFGQPGGAATYRTLLTQLERDGYVIEVGKIGKAAAFALTDKGKRVVV